MSSRADQLQAFLDRTPFARFVGMKVDIEGDNLIARLPFQGMFIGNRAINALHGGATGAFLEMTAISQLYLQSDLQRLPKTINLTIDYLRSAKGGEDLYAHAIVHKLGRRMASVRAEAWQGDKDKPVTALQAHFLVSEEG